MNGEIEGPDKAWQVKSFPPGLLDEIKVQAKARNMRVDHYATQVWQAVRANNWQVTGADGQPVNAETPPPVSMTRLARAVEVANALAAQSDKMPKRVASAAFFLVYKELRALKLIYRPIPSAPVPQITHDGTE